MRTFHLHRSADLSGRSGTGVVAQGVVFDDGTVAMRWLTAVPSTGVYASIRAVEQIHSHGGHGRVVFDDGQPSGATGELRVSVAERVAARTGGRR